MGKHKKRKKHVVIGKKDETPKRIPKGNVDAKAKVVEDIIGSIIQTNPKPPQLIQEVYATKLLEKILVFDNPVITKSLSKAKNSALKHKLSNCTTVRYRKLARQQLTNIPKNEQLQYDSVLGLQQKWLAYAQNILSSTNDIATVMTSLDFCGALAKVVACKIPSLVHKEGIILHISSSAARIICKDNVMHCKAS